jgi:anaerobic dimethyl sulfoxide reductase subunit B (iron-sulfur subunit)
MQRAFYFNQTRCIGCGTCIVACKDWHEDGLGTEPADWRWVLELETGFYPYPTVNYVSLSCLHCTQPGCVDVCPIEAIYKRPEDGIVAVDRQKCLGKDECGALCESACPYQAPRFGPEANAKMQKCDFCVERWAEGKLPVCVAACPVRALDAGDLEELRQRYGSDKEAPGFEYSKATQPSILVRAK